MHVRAKVLPATSLTRVSKPTKRTSSLRANECASYAEAHEHRRLCAEACRRCEEACNELLARLG